MEKGEIKMSKPNVIFILADDMGYGDFGMFGDGIPETPVLDQLAADGICLTQHYSASSVCAPARAALLTGRYPHRTGAIELLELRGSNRLALRERTMADLFKSAGYTTGLIGKWHLGSIGSAYHPNSRGFDEFVGFCGGMNDYYDYRLQYNRTIKSSDGRHMTDVFADETIHFLRRHSGEPFFLHLAFNAPHTPLQAPEELVQYFRNKGAAEGPAIVYAMVYQMDQAIGRILKELRNLQIEDNTIVIFTSDNGPQFGTHYRSYEVYRSGRMLSDIHLGLLLDRYNAGYKDSKSSVYEGGIRVPGIIRWPGKLRGGRTLNDFVHFTDWLPTLSAAAGIDLPSELHLDGYNILPLLSGDLCSISDKRFWQWNRYEPLVTCNAAMRDGDWKLIRPKLKEAMYADPSETGPERDIVLYPERYTEYIHKPFPDQTIPPALPPLLFNLKEDPGEKVDLAEKYPERVSHMLKELENWFISVEQDRASIVE